MDDDKIFIFEDDEEDAPIKIVYNSDTKVEQIGEYEYKFTKTENVTINDETQLWNYIKNRISQGYDIVIKQKDSFATINIDLN